jgi:hypothetical protein
MPSRVKRFPAISQEAKGPMLSSVTARPRVAMYYRRIAYCGPGVWPSEKCNARECPFIACCFVLKATA